MRAVHLTLFSHFFAVKIIYYDIHNLFKKLIIFKFQYMIPLQLFSKIVLNNIDLLSKNICFQS